MEKKSGVHSRLTGEIISAAIKVHSTLGPGLLESTYRACLQYELQKRGLRVQSEVPVPISYDGVTIDVGYRIDLLVESTVIVELKAVTKLHPVHEAQLLSHLKLSRLEVGLLINFHCPLLKSGIKRLINK
jgi:GxxExxY protein